MSDKKAKSGIAARTVEIAVSLGIGALFIILTVPASMKARQHADIKRVVAQGQQLRQILIDANNAAGAREDSSALWATNQRSSSTAYFKEFFTSDLYTNAFPADLLAARGIPAFDGTDLKEFGGSNNAWCITMPLEIVSEVTSGFERQTNDFPLLFTANFSAGNPRDTLLSQISELEPKEPPFGRDVGVLITYKGEAVIIRARDLSSDVKLQSLFNPTSATNHFLTPWTRREQEARSRLRDHDRRKEKKDKEKKDKDKANKRQEEQ